MPYYYPAVPEHPIMFDTGHSIINIQFEHPKSFDKGQSIINIEPEVLHYFVAALGQENIMMDMDDIFFNLLRIEIRSNINCNSTY